MSNRQYLNMIWGNEAGKSLWLFKAEHGRVGLEIRGLVDQREQVLADITIEKHNLDRIGETIRLYREQQGDDNRATCSRGGKIGESMGIVP